jgi:hypothetical protein
MSYRMSVSAAQEIMDVQSVALIEIKYLLAVNKTVERTARRMEAVRRMHDKKARSKSRSRSLEGRSHSPGLTRGRALPSSSSSLESCVQHVPFLSRSARFAILCSERNVFNARVQKELVVNELK